MLRDGVYGTVYGSPPNDTKFACVCVFGKLDEVVPSSKLDELDGSISLPGQRLPKPQAQSHELEPL